MANEFLVYIAQSSIAFALLLCIYRISVSRLTFHKFNRMTLLVLPILSSILPLVDLAFPVTDLGVSSKMTFLNDILLYSQAEEPSEKVIAEVISSNNGMLFPMGISKTVFLVYLIGFAITFIWFSLSTFKILELKRKSKAIKIKGHHVFLTQGSSIFSFYNWIFIPELKKSSIDTKVLEHEAMHLKYHHTYDLIYLQIYTALFWFNPILKVYRKSLKSVHEFQVDASVIENGTKPSEYLNLILADIEQKAGFQSLSYFNNLIIKKRIEMIEKTKSKKYTIARYSFLGITAMAITLGLKKPEINTVEKFPKQSIEQTVITEEPPSIFPVKGYDRGSITSGFGQKVRHPKTGLIVVHGGIDIKAPKGTPVLATSNGIVVQASLESDWGNLVIIEHDSGYQTWYGYLNGFEVSTKTTVEKGDIIGYVGSTGLSSGDHLHYEVRKEGKHLNPKDFF